MTIKINKQGYLELGILFEDYDTNKDLKATYTEVINKIINKFQGSFS